MFSSLLFSLFFETVEPSYGTLLQFFPETVIAGAPSTLTLAPQQQAPLKTGVSIGPVIEARSVYAMDLASGTPLFVRDIFTRRHIASIAKLVTAMVILDAHKLDEKTTVSQNAATQEGSSMKLKRGEQITVENLLTGMLVNSGNDAAVALAELDAGNESHFVEKMNEKAQALGLKDTHFSNAKGFDEPANYSTAFDTMIFARAALTYPFIKKTAATKTGDVASVDGKTHHRLESTNELLEHSSFHVIGLKTGHTPEAGESFVSLALTSDGHEILSVMLDSPNRFKETKILLDWIYRNFAFPKA